MLTQEQDRKIKELTGFSFQEIMAFSQGEFVRHIYKLFFTHRISKDQYNWLVSRFKEKNKVMDPFTKEVLEIFGGEVVS